MALSKKYTNDYGIVTNYHKIGQISMHNGMLHCILESYVSKDFRDNRKLAASQQFRFKISVEEEESMGIRALCYKKIKELDDWKDAEDC